MKALNVKSGDRAIVDRPGHAGHGHAMAVLYPAPEDEFFLPDGQKSVGAGFDSPKWVVRLDRPVNATIHFGLGGSETRAAMFGVVPDELLRKINTETKEPK